MFCKVCNQHLYQNLDISNLFSFSSIHKKCKKYINIESKLTVIPIENNEIYFEYLFTKKEDLNYEYIFLNNMIHILKKYTQSSNWSIIFFYEEAEYSMLSDECIYLLLHLGQKPFVFISMFAY